MTEEGDTEGEPDDTERLDRVSERSPLAKSLLELVAADDRGAVANQRNLDVRNGEVRVLVELESAGARPDEYLSTVTTEYRTMVVAWVEIDELVDLAADENSSLVRPEPPAHPHGGRRPRSSR